MKRIFNAVAGFLLVAFIAAPVYAFTPIQAPILSAAAVTPNVMMLLDNSGSMDSIIWHEGYDDSTTYAAVQYCGGNSGGCTWTAVGETTTYYPNSIRQSSCATGERLFRRGNGAPSRCLRMYDPVGGNSTRYKGNYLSYLIRNEIPNASLVNDFRMNVAREVTKEIVSDNRGLRYGLFSLGTGSNQAGGALLRDVRDFSESQRPDGTFDVTAEQAQTNYNNFVTSVDALRATTWTPLAEAYYEVTRYYRGMSRFQGTGSGNYVSPIQYRCQRNFGIVVTDGLPTFDRTFPTNDPLRDNPLVAGGNNLPNWDGVNNDGNNINGDGEGDTLYLDDIAKFAYDVDLRDLTTTDLAGKSFNDPGFRKQNMLTYTVGFAVNNQMLQDAANYGNGRYYTASNSEQLNDSLTRAINEISSKAGSGGAGASSSATLTTETFYYKTLYDPKDWRGTIEAYQLNPATGRPLNTAPDWSTDNTITPTTNGASYQTFRTGASPGVVSLDYSLLDAAQQSQLNVGATSLNSSLTGASLLTWLKGSNMTGLRTRSVLLGDVVNSSLENLSPEGVLASSLSGDSSYTDYLTGKRANMTRSLLVNANDGLFHVINAETGQHRYGYMPASLMSSLHIVADPAYVTSGTHNFMVDGPISVGDAQLGTNWATVAVGGMGAGGKSVFAVKLFMGTSNNIDALWEVSPPAANTPADDWNDLGYSYSKAVIARTQAGRWVAVFGNGYGSHEGKAVLYVVDMADGSLVQKVVVDENTSGTAAERAAGNGLSSPEVVLDAQGRIERIYAGDLRGNLWAFTGSALNPFRLFAAGNSKPITVQPMVYVHPDGGHLVMLGTGKLNEVNDKFNKEPQAFYAIWDGAGNTTTVTQESLLQQTFVRERSINGETYVDTSNTQIDWTTHKGWYLPLVLGNVQEGERVIYKAQVTLGRVVFVTAKVDAEDPCDSSGSGRLMELDALSGSKLSYPVLDTNGDGIVDDLDEMVSGLNINEGLPGQPVIIDGGAEKLSQTKIILLSTGETITLDEDFACIRRGNCGEEEGGPFSRRIMWRQLQ